MDTYMYKWFDSMDGIGTPPWMEKVVNVGNTFSRVESGTETEKMYGTYFPAEASPEDSGLSH